MSLKPVNTVMMLDLGKRGKKKIKALKRGEGELVDEITQYLKENGAGEDVVPVVILFEKKPKKRLRSPLFPPYVRL